jgi:molybdopterin synthase sulfur carrier subunit
MAVSVKVKIPTMMREAVGGRPVVEGDGETVRDVIQDIERRYPALAGSIVGEDGGLHRFVNVYLNSEDVRYLGSLETEVSEGDTVAILPAVAGGA